MTGGLEVQPSLRLPASGGSSEPSEECGNPKENNAKIIYDDFLFGEIQREGVIKRMNHFVKELVDFEKITPVNELKDVWWKKMIKVGLRKIM